MVPLRGNNRPDEVVRDGRWDHRINLIALTDDATRKKEVIEAGILEMAAQGPQTPALAGIGRQRINMR